MPDRIVELDGVRHIFPADATDAEIESALGDHNLTQSDSGAIGAAALGAGIPAAAHGLSAFAQSPAVPRITGRLANAATTIGALGHGIYTGNMTEALAAPIAGWQAGKGGYFLGKAAQSVASPVAKGLATISPYAQAASTLGGAQGIGDLAQMAEPNRRDIGTFGIGPSVDVPGAEPPVINALIEKLMGYIRGRQR